MSKESEESGQDMELTGGSKRSKGEGNLPQRESAAGIVRDGALAKMETRGSYAVTRLHDDRKKGPW